jgi:hypothetical protein
MRIGLARPGVKVNEMRLDLCDRATQLSDFLPQRTEGRVVSLAASAFANLGELSSQALDVVSDRTQVYRALLNHLRRRDDVNRLARLATYQTLSLKLLNGRPRDRRRHTEGIAQLARGWDRRADRNLSRRLRPAVVMRLP